MIPGIPYFKIGAGLAIFLIIFFAYRFISNYVDDANQAHADLALAQETIQGHLITIAQKDAALEREKEVGRIRDEFQNAKAALIDGFQTQRQALLNSQAEMIAQMGNASQMADVSALDNGFSKGNERLTFRAQARTDEISRRLEALSAHENLYSGPDYINSGNP